MNTMSLQQRSIRLAGCSPGRAAAPRSTRAFRSDRPLSAPSRAPARCLGKSQALADSEAPDIELVSPDDTVEAWARTEDLKTASPNDSLQELLDSLCNYHGLPVVDQEQKVVGVIARADVEKALEEEGLPTSTPVSEVMTSPAFTIPARAHLAHAAEVMISRGIHRLPMVDSAGKLLGILSHSDIFTRHIDQVADLRDWADRTHTDPFKGLVSRGAMSWTSESLDSLDGEDDDAAALEAEVYTCVYDGTDPWCESLANMLQEAARKSPNAEALRFVDSSSSTYEHNDHAGITRRANRHNVHVIDGDGEHHVHGLEAVDILYEAVGIPSRAQAAENPLLGTLSLNIYGWEIEHGHLQQLHTLEQVALYKHFKDVEEKHKYLP